MSLFGGDLPSSPGFPTEDSDFSIEEINPIEPPVTPRISSSNYAPSETDNEVPITQDLHDNPYPDTDTDAESAFAESNRLDRKWARTFRHRTEVDRSIAASIDQVRANDLGIHLYNTHALKARLREADKDKGQLDLRQSKTKWIPKDKTTGDKQWYPDADWTAWPLEPEIIPDPTLLFGAPSAEPAIDQYTIKRVDHKRDKPSRHVQEELYATFLKQAKATWNKTWAAYRQHTASTKQHVPSQSQHDSHERSMSQDPARSRSRSVSRAPSVSSMAEDPGSSLAGFNSSPPSQQSSPSAHIKSSPPVPSRPSVGLKAEETDQGQGQGQPDSDMGTRPVFSADDEASHRLLAPTVRHLMSKLDHLLLALHHQREGHYLRNKETAYSSDASASDRSASRSTSVRSTSERRQRASTPAVKMNKNSSEHQPQNDADMVDASPDYSDGHTSAQATPRNRTSSRSPNPSPASSYRTRIHKLGLRDWSEVLGVAALAGWDPAIVQRAAKRCSALFGESMTFRTLPEHGPPREDGGASTADSDSSSDDNAGPTEGYLCPFPMCVRHAAPFERAWRWRDHLKRSHQQTVQDIVKLEREAEERMSRGHTTTPGKIRRVNLLDFNPRNWTPPTPLKCPHCTNSPVYPKPGRLIDHLKRTHKYDPRISDGPPPPTSNRKAGKRPVRSISTATSIPSDPETVSDDHGSSSSDDDDSDDDSADEMYGGVHVDGFLTPIFKRNGRGKDKEARLKRDTVVRTKLELKAAKRKRDLLEEEEERVFGGRSSAAR